MASVDETPLSAAPHERRNSLEKHLQMRPDVQDLKDRHILLDTNISPYAYLQCYASIFFSSISFLTNYYYSSLQAARQELDRQRTQDNLKKNLEKRPEREELIERMPIPSHFSHFSHQH